jgi:hypothetical protein
VRGHNLIPACLHAGGPRSCGSAGPQHLRCWPPASPLLATLHADACRVRRSTVQGVHLDASSDAALRKPCTAALRSPPAHTYGIPLLADLLPARPLVRCCYVLFDLTRGTHGHGAARLLRANPLPAIPTFLLLACQRSRDVLVDGCDLFIFSPGLLAVNPLAFCRPFSF